MHYQCILSIFHFTIIQSSSCHRPIVELDKAFLAPSGKSPGLPLLGLFTVTPDYDELFLKGTQARSDPRSADQVPPFPRESPASALPPHAEPSNPAAPPGLGDPTRTGESR